MPFDHLAGRETFRDRAETLVVATTGTMALAATTTGFTRATGSFNDDGFQVGMEVVPAGFTSNTPAIVTRVEPLTLSILGTRSAQASGSGRSLTVGLPLDRRWHGTQTPVTTSPATRPRLIERWSPSLTEDLGAIVDTGFHLFTWEGLANYGIAAMLVQMQALRDLFPPGFTGVVDGNLLRVTGRPAPRFTDPVTSDDGRLSSTLSIPWRIVTTNLEVA